MTGAERSRRGAAFAAFGAASAAFGVAFAAFGVAFGAWLMAAASARAASLGVTVESAALAAFFGHPVTMRADVLLPDEYGAHPERRYPAIYVIHAFNGTYRKSVAELAVWRDAFARAKTPFVAVFLDASYPAGHNAFADSQNDGPWATALTTEFVPQLERQIRLDPRPAGRFLFGHSSGGWAALWLQITDPDTFGGAWSVAPDPVDFHDFTGADLTADPPANFYRAADGERPFVRVRGRDTSTLRAYASDEARRGSAGQFDSFEAVFSPRGAAGTPLHLFDRATGAIDPTVAAYWEAHWDIARILCELRPALRAELAGKLNIFVGTADTFHLETSVGRLAERLSALGSDAHVTFAPGRDHYTIFGFDGGLIARAVREMAAARSAALAGP